MKNMTIVPKYSQFAAFFIKNFKTSFQRVYTVCIRTQVR